MPDIENGSEVVGSAIGFATHLLTVMNSGQPSSSVMLQSLAVGVGVGLSTHILKTVFDFILSKFKKQ